MPRYVQKILPDGSSKLVEVGQSRSTNHSAAVQGDIESFVSPIDGSVITDRKQYRDHMKKHGVVPSAEFSPEFLDRKAKERERHYTGERTKEQVQRDRMRINEIINTLERR